LFSKPASLNFLLERNSRRLPYLSLKGVLSFRFALQIAQVIVTVAPMMTASLSIIQAEGLTHGGSAFQFDWAVSGINQIGGIIPAVLLCDVL